MTQETKHTPLPWTAIGKVIYGQEPEDGQIGGCHSAYDAEFIAQACNSHYELVEALEDILNTLNTLGVETERMELAQKAIKKAKGIE